MKRTLLTLFAMLIATAMALPAQAEITCDEGDPVTTVDVGTSTYEITFCGSEVVDGNTDFKYNVKEIDGHDLSHFTLELCEPLVILDWSPKEDDPEISDEDGVEFGNDPTTGVSGIKWNFEDGFSERMFTFTVEGIVGTEDVDVAFKTGSGDNKGTTTGPSCEAEICTIETIPSWDGVVNFQPAMAFIDLETPNGFKSIEIMGSSDNIVLLEVVGESTTGSNPLSSDPDFLSGYGLLEFAGGTPPTNVTVKFGPQTEAGSTFMFRVTDQLDCTLQVDPQINMTVPETVELRGNYPNPFNPSTSIEFSLPEAMDVQLDVYDAMGRLVKSLVNDNLEAGVHNVSWNGTDVAGRSVASGAYFYRVQTGSVVQTKQMILLK